MGNMLKDMEQLADINDQMRRQLDRSNAIILELNHRLVERDAEIAALRQQVAELQATVAAVKRKAQKFGDIADDWQKLANEKPEDSPKSGGFARISSVYAVCAAELREVIGIE